MFMIRSLFIGVLGGALVSLHAQTTQPNPIPASKIAFDTSEGTPISLPSLMITMEPVCYSSDSCAANFALLPATSTDAPAQAAPFNPKDVTAYFDLSGKVHAIDPAALEDLSYVQILSATPTGNGVAILIHGASTEGDNAARLVPKSGSEPPRSKVDWGYFVCFFDSDGKPQGIQRIDSRYKAARIAYLGADRVLLLLFDQVNEKAVLSIMKDDGRIVRILDDEGSLPGTSELAKGSAVRDGDLDVYKRLAAASELTGWQFGNAGGRLLLLKPGADAAIWSISPGGEIRKVKLKLPPGVQVDSIVSSDHAWIVRSWVPPSSPGPAFQVDPENGEVLRRIDTDPAPSSSILFASQGTYYAFWWDKDQHPFIVKSK